MKSLSGIRVLGLACLLVAGAALATGQGYVLQYEETFASDPIPPWETNNPTRYYRDVNSPGLPAAAYRAIMYDNTSEYGTVPLVHDGGSFRITCDVLIDAMNWAGNFDVGWYDESRECYNHAGGRQMVKLGFGIGDLGKGIGLYAWDDAGAIHETGQYPTSAWTTNVWYGVTFTYDKSAATLSVEMRDAATGTLQWAGTVDGVSGFSALAHLGLSKVSDTYAPSAYGKGWVDNVRVYRACALTLTYEEMFDDPPNPPWQTNNPNRYYWDVNAPGLPSPSYRALMYDNTNEYGTVALGHHGGCFVLEYDWIIESVNWAGNFNFGWYDESRECYNHDPSKQMLNFSCDVADLGKGINLIAWDDAGNTHQVGQYPTTTWDFGTPYHVRIAYDDIAHTLSVEMSNISSDVAVFSGQVTGVSGFSALEHLGLSKVSDTYAPSAYGKGWVDNIRLFTETSHLGDLNCDGLVNFGDIDPFVLALTDGAGYAAAYPNCDRDLADCNQDGYVDFGDINPFVAILSGN